MKKIRIAIVDDQNLFRQSLAILVRSIADFELVVETENGRAFLERIKELETLPDIALIDLNMPEINGVELNNILHEKYPSIKVIVLTVYSRTVFITRMIEAGACGYLLKNCDKDELVAAVHTVMKSGFYLNSSAMEAIRNGSRSRSNEIRNFNSIPITLSGREKEVLKLICEENSNAEIAKKLFLSIRTVEGHRNNLLAKVGCRNTAGLVVFAIKHGLFEVIF